MDARGDLRGYGREDEQRKRDAATVQTLQQQVDEVRHLTRELLSRQARLEEDLKASQAGWAQHRLALEQHRHEVAQAAQARQLEEARVRQQLTELGTRLDDTTRPIRSLQAHVSELLESTRRQRDDAGQDTRRYDELRVLIDHLAAHGERQVAIAQSLRESIDALRTDVERLQRDLLRTDDSVKIVDQEARRRVAEFVHQLENLEVRLDDGLGGIGALEARIEEVAASLTTIDPQFVELRDVDQRLEADMGRFYAQLFERDDLATERIEELRRQLTSQIKDHEQVDEQRFERVVRRADDLDAIDRDLAYRISLIEVRLDELAQVDDRLRREVWYLQEQRARLRLEQAQQELETVIDARRESEERWNPDGRSE